MKKSYEFEADANFHRAIEQLLHLAARAGEVGASGYLSVYIDGDGPTRPKLSSVSPTMRAIAAEAIGSNQSPFGAGHGLAFAHARGCNITRDVPGDMTLRISRQERIVISRDGCEDRVTGVKE